MTLFYPDNLPDSIKDEIKETERIVKSKIDAYNTDRSNFAEAVVKEKILSPLDDVLKNWRDLRMEQSEEALFELIKRRSEVIRAYVENMTPDEMRLTIENLAKMETLGNKFAELLVIGTDPEKKAKYGWVENALRYVMGLPLTGKSAASTVEDGIEQDIATHLLELLPRNPANSINTNEESNAAFSWMLLAFAKPEQKRRIMEKCLKDPKLEERAKDRGEDLKTTQKTLLEALCERGAISPLEMEELGGRDNFSDQEIHDAATMWEEKYGFLERARHLAAESYGARNAANEMFTLTNIIKIFGYVVGTTTVVFNGICNWKTLKKNPSAFFKMPQVWLGAAEILTATYMDSDKNLSEITASKETLATWNATKSREALLAVISASPRGWKPLLEDDNYVGLRVMAEFVSQKCTDNKDLKEDEATVANFETFLNEQKKSNQEKAQIYDRLLSQLKQIKEGEKSEEITDTRFKKLANAFIKLDILGDNNQVKIYRDNLDIAQGKAPRTESEPPIPPVTTPPTTQPA
jgi:hypothetical protein